MDSGKIKEKEMKILVVGKNEHLSRKKIASPFFLFYNTRIQSGF